MLINKRTNVPNIRSPLAAALCQILRRQGSCIKGAAPGPTAAAGSCDGAAPVRREGAAIARRQISNVSDEAAPPKFDKKFQISKKIY